MNLKGEELEEAKRNAALRSVEHVKDGFVVGLGSGSTTAHAIEEMGRRVENEELKILGVPTSYQAFLLAVQHGIQITTLEEHPSLDLAIDGADQIDDHLNLIKGRGGALAREKIVAAASEKLIIIADETKKVKRLGENDQAVPLEVLPMAAAFVMRKTKEYDGNPSLRESSGKVGPLITDNGNVIVDVVFGPVDEPAKLEGKLKLIPGVVETGLFVDLADLVYIGKSSGVEELKSRRSRQK